VRFLNKLGIFVALLYLIKQDIKAIKNMLKTALFKLKGVWHVD